MKKSAIVITHGYFGDILFSTSVAKPLKQQFGYETVDYLIGFPQVAELITDNPDLDDVYWNVGQVGPYVAYDHFVLESEYDIFQIQRMMFRDPPPIQMQKDCGIHEPFLNPEYSVCTYDYLVNEWRDRLVEKANGKPIVAWGNDMYDRAFEFTREEYERAVDVPNLGYGGRLRDIDYMIKELSRWFYMVEVGAKHTSQHDLQMKGDDKDLPTTAAIMKACDMYFGIEGGLINIAAGVGTPTIMLSEFVHQLYGPKGVLMKIPEPKLGPVYYFGPKNHVRLPLYKDTDELINITRKYIFNFLR